MIKLTSTNYILDPSDFQNDKARGRSRETSSQNITTYSELIDLQIYLQKI